MTPSPPAPPPGPPPGWRVEPEYYEAYRAYADARTPEAADGLLKAVDPVVRMGVATYGGGDSPIIRGHARRIAVDALAGYDPARASLRTHLMSHMRGLRRHAARRERYVSAPERLLLDRSRVSASRAALLDDLGREPSDSELADHARIPLARLAEVRSYSAATTPGMRDAAAAAGGYDALDQVVDDPGAGARRADLLYHDLNPTDQVILERALGLRGAPRASHREIAEMLGISPSAVTQRAARIQERLDELADLGVG